MKTAREVRKITRTTPTIEGAGVHLQRVFGFGQEESFDPFLLLDHFGSDDPDDYRRGFPWHPHRGMETITYILRGNVEHGDSLGNKGIIGSGDVQWMTAGSGIIHQEMPQGDDSGGMWGFQLWANLPRSHKMMKPRYQELKAAQIPEVVQPDGVRIKVVAGSVAGVNGPVRDIIIDPQYLDVAIPGRGSFDHPVTPGHTCFAYVFEGEGHFDEAQKSLVPAGHLLSFGDGERVVVKSGDGSLRFLLIAGRPIGEPVAWHGPIVMNTEEELRVAFAEYRAGTFIHP
jgi:redox-sensitive bicupin YhaK (pirin superfamily)